MRQLPIDADADVERTLSCAEVYGTPSQSKSKDMILRSSGRHSRSTKQELLISHSVVVPTCEEDGLETFNDASLRRKFVDGVRPELSNQLDYRMSAVYDAGM